MNGGAVPGARGECPRMGREGLRRIVAFSGEEPWSARSSEVNLARTMSWDVVEPMTGEVRKSVQRTNEWLEEFDIEENPGHEWCEDANRAFFPATWFPVWRYPPSRPRSPPVIFVTKWNICNICGPCFFQRDLELEV